MGATQERIAGLSPEKRALLERRLAQKGAPASAPTIRRRTEADPSVLSFTQQQMWFLDQLQPGTATYNVPFYMRLRGALDVESLRKSVDAVIARHHVLRTVFAAPQGTPIPVLLKKWQAPFNFADLRNLPEPAREAEARRLLETEAARPFNFARDLMLRMMLVQLADEEFLFLHLSHHVAWDLRSREVLYQELTHNYAAFRAGRAPSLPELPIQYEDYALWQREWLQGANLEKLVSYWKQQLAGAPSKLELPTDRSRPPVQSLRGAKISASFPAELAEATRSFCRQSGFTPYMTLLAAFNAFLHALTGEEDLCVGSPIASRPHPETEPLIGFFINTVVMRARLAQQPTFLELIGRVKKTTLDALAHQALPFDKLVEAIRPPRDLSRMPLFQVNFRVQAGSPTPLALDGLTAELPVFLDSGTSKFDLGLEFPITAESRGFWEYSTDLFDESTVAQMAGDFSKLIGGLLAQPEQPIHALPIFRELCARWQKPQMSASLEKAAPPSPPQNSRPQLKRRTAAPTPVPQKAPGKILQRKAVLVTPAPADAKNSPSVPIAAAPANPRPEFAPILRRPAGEPSPLSFAQQRLWFLDQLQPNTATYNIPYYSRLRGPLNVPALQQAIAAVVTRHEVLRTVFACETDTPTQILLPSWGVTLLQIDLRDVPPAERETRAQELLRTEAARPFNLQRDVMLRVALLQLADDEFYFLHTSHHIAWEYWSTALWFAELSKHYAAFCHGQLPTLSELPVQYADYARWQRQWLQGEAYERLVAYWKNQLAGAPPKLELPIDHPRPPIQSLRGARVPMDLPADVLDAAKSVSRDCGATPFMTLLAGFQTFLYCLTGQTDICVGTPVASRPKAETKGLIGFFANTLVVRTRLGDDPNFRQLVERVRAATLGAIANQALPFDKLVEVLRPPRDLSRMPLFQVNFRAQRAPLEALQLEGLNCNPPVFIDNGTSKFDLALEVVATPGGAGCNSGGFWEYSFDLFEPETIQRMSREFEQVLRGVVAEPGARLNSLEIVRALRHQYQNARLG